MTPRTETSGSREGATANADGAQQADKPATLQMEASPGFPPIFTAWAAMPGDDVLTEEQRASKLWHDTQFRAHVQGVMSDLFPWLAPILAGSDTAVVAGPGKFHVVYGPNRDQFVEIPAIGARLLLVPWQVHGETRN